MNVFPANSDTYLNERQYSLGRHGNLKPARVT